MIYTRLPFAWTPEITKTQGYAKGSYYMGRKGAGLEYRQTVVAFYESFMVCYLLIYHHRCGAV